GDLARAVSRGARLVRREGRGRLVRRDLLEDRGGRRPEDDTRRVAGREHRDREGLGLTLRRGRAERRDALAVRRARDRDRRVGAARDDLQDDVEDVVAELVVRRDGVRRLRDAVSVDRLGQRSDRRLGGVRQSAVYGYEAATTAAATT